MRAAARPSNSSTVTCLSRAFCSGADSASKSYRRKSLTAWAMAASSSASLFAVSARSRSEVADRSARKAHTSPIDVHTVPSSKSAANAKPAATGPRFRRTNFRNRYAADGGQA